MSVVDFPTSEYVWQCSCGCQAFYIVSSDGNYAQCHECEARHPVILTLIPDESAANDGE